MSRKNYKSDEAYAAAKVLERERYYTGTGTGGGHTWSVSEDDFLLRNNNLTAKELSAALGRSVKAIEHRRHRLRVSGSIDVAVVY